MTGQFGGGGFTVGSGNGEQRLIPERGGELHFADYLSAGSQCRLIQRGFCRMQPRRNYDQTFSGKHRIIPVTDHGTTDPAGGTQLCRRLSGNSGTEDRDRFHF